jgi:hypothetical protein
VTVAAFDVGLDDGTFVAGSAATSTACLGFVAAATGAHTVAFA